MPHARTTDPVTSHEAAESVTNLTETQKIILDLFAKHKHLTDDQLVSHYFWLFHTGKAKPASESGIRSRRSELVKAGKIVDSTERLRLVTGRNAIVWTRA